MTASSFIATVAPIAIKLRLEGSPIFPSVRIAQSGLETGWRINAWNNLVGFKVGSRPPNGYWKGDYVNKGTWEVYDGKRTDVVAAFRAYDTIEDCFRDQDELFKLSRYDRVRNAQTPEEQADMLYACGYATDPQYATKLVSIINANDLKKYDDMEVDEEMKLSDNEWKMVAATLKKFYENGVISDESWITKAENKELTTSELTFLNLIMLSRK